MTKRSKYEMAKMNASITHYTIKCGWCEKISVYEALKVSITSGSSECELCGSHGFVDAYVKCVFCGKDIEIDIKSW